MIKIRLMRIGSKKRPFYRIVAVDERKKRTGGYLDLLGTYNPLTTPKEININKQKVEEWVKKGAVMSEGYLRIIGKAPQHPARPSKKAQPEAKAQTSTPAAEEASAETPSEETAPVEAAAEETVETTQEPESDQAEAVEEGSK